MKPIRLTLILSVLLAPELAGRSWGQASTEGTSPTLPSSATDASEVETLVAQLSGDDWNTRRRAQAKLVGFGDGVVPRLEQLLRGTHDAEARTRAEAALKQIEIDRATGPSHITLNLNGVTPAVAFEAIAAQARCSFGPQPPALFAVLATQTVSVNVKRESFWNTVLPLCRSSGVWLTVETGLLAGFSPRVQLNESDPDTTRSPAFVSGAFLVLAESINRSHSVTLTRPDDVERDFSVNLRIYAEPKLKVLGGEYNATVTSAVDENGRSMTPPRLAETSVDQALSDAANWPWNASLSLTEPQTVGKRIAMLKGSVKFLVQSVSERAELRDVMHGKDRRVDVAGARFTLEPIVTGEGADQYVVQVRVEQRQMSAARWAHMTSGNVARWYSLVDARGNSLTPNDQSSEQVEHSETKQVHKVTFGTRNPHLPDGKVTGEPAVLQLEILTETRMLDVPFEFLNLPIP